MKSLSLAAHSAYQDLLELHRTNELAAIAGKPILKTINGTAHWYERRRIGAKIKDRYLGPDSETLRSELDSRHDKKRIEKFRERTSSLAAQLRAAGLPAIDRETGKVMNALAKTGTFRLGGILVGTHAFNLYSSELGVRPQPELGGTEDIDIAGFENLSLAIDDNVDPALATLFADLNLEPVMSHGKKQQHVTKWRLPEGGLSVEFLAPRMQADRETVALPALGVWAQALSFLNYLIGDPIDAVALYRNGILMRIPRPERYAVHKLIVAVRRKNPHAAKARKDFAQANSLAEILATDRPDELAAAWQDAWSRGPKWRETLEKAISRDSRSKDLFAGLAA